PGTGDLTLQTTLIDTTMLTIGGSSPPSEVIFDRVPQAGGNGLDLAVLHTRELTIGQGAVVQVAGASPLVIVAGADVTIAGKLEAGAHLTTPGPGGSTSGGGRGAGGDGMTVPGTFYAAGGGGGGFGAAGGAGGKVRISSVPLVEYDGGVGGSPYGDPVLEPLFEGGSGGGFAGPGVCSTAPKGGGGGGAIQI